MSVIAAPLTDQRSSTSLSIAASGSSLTLWGLTPAQLHDGFWRSRGVQCVRRGIRQPFQRGAELFLLLEPDQLTLFDITRMVERLTWHNASVTRLRLIDESEAQYSEHVVFDDAGVVKCIERRYGAAVRGSSRVMITRSRRVASMWMSSRSRRDGWDRVRRSVPWSRVDHQKAVGRTFLASNTEQEQQLLDELVERWPQPSQAIANLQETVPGVWHVSGENSSTPGVRVGPLWIGHGGSGAQQRCLVGPAWIADHTKSESAARKASLKDIVDVELPEVSFQETVDIAPQSPMYHVCKRAFDIIASLCALLIFLPLMALAGLAVWLESGKPLFFGHQRQGKGGRFFRCWKFRTMLPDAEKLARQLDDNQCDGPQVNIRNDPRVTRVGHVLRRTNIDELPQFWNVLRGDMSLVGPRPSPDDENQFCPAWRDLRLSVRPGITGLWQLKRTREPGEDFQEWIKYDIEYVQKASFWFDLMILIRTAVLVLRGRASSAAE